MAALITSGISSGTESVPAQIQTILLDFLTSVQLSGEYVSQIADIHPPATTINEEIQNLLNDIILEISLDPSQSSILIADAIAAETLINEVLAAMRINSNSNVPPDTDDGSTDAEQMFKDEADPIFDEINTIIEAYPGIVNQQITSILTDLNAYKARLASARSPIDLLKITRNPKTVESLLLLSGSENVDLDKLIKNIAGGTPQVINAFFGDAWDAALIETKALLEDSLLIIAAALDTADSTLAQVKIDELRTLPLDYAEYLSEQDAYNLRNGTWQTP